jgi:succinate-semialdehyde dehydrogenase/glutarate-semialdehyde dehydrogenase
MKAKRMGDPLVPGIDVGPLARRDLRDDLQQQVQRSLRQGRARCSGGNPRPDRPAFFAPCVLTDVTPGMAAFDEELFGPVAALVGRRTRPMRSGSPTERVRARRGGVHLRPRARRADRRRVDRGRAVFVNTFVRSDPRLPFGGIKESGYGRELSSFGIREFVNVKTVYVK